MEYENKKFRDKNECAHYFFQPPFLAKFALVKYLAEIGFLWDSERLIDQLMKTVIAVLLFLFPVTSAWGQSLSPWVIAAAGDYYVNTSANASLSFTVAELTLVETFQNQGNFLTQGFQQPEINLVGVEEEDLFYEFVVFPNPASADLHFRYRLRQPGQVEMRLVNMNGVPVLPTYRDRYGAGLTEDYFDVRGLAQGLYFLEVHYRSNNGRIDHHRNYKINVIRF